MSTIIDFSIVPMDKGESVSPYVARAVAIIKKSGLPYRFGPMGTSMEGEWPDVMAVVEQCFDALKKDCHRVYMTLKVDYRKGEGRRLQGKMASVEQKIERSKR